MNLTVIHDRLATAILLFSILAGVWALVSALRRRGVDGNLWGILASGELLFLAQGVIGSLQWLSGARPERSVHILYGIVTALTLPAYYAFSRGRDDRRAAWAYAGLCLFVAVISLRAATTGG